MPTADGRRKEEYDTASVFYECKLRVFIDDPYRIYISLKIVGIPNDGDLAESMTAVCSGVGNISVTASRGAAISKNKAGVGSISVKTK